MRIGIDINKAIKPCDGMGNYNYHLVRALMDLDRENEYLLYDPRRAVTARALARTYPTLPPNVSARLKRDARDDGLDVFHCTTWSWPPGYAGRAVFTCYDLTFMTHPDFHVLDNKLHSVTGTVQALVGNAHFIAISEFTRQSMIDLLGLDEARISVVYPAGDCSLSPSEPEAARKRLAKSHGLQKPFVLNVGTIEPRKNQLRLVKAYAGLPEARRKEIDLVVAGGEGWLNSEFHRYLETHPELRGVRVLGYVKNRDLADLYSACTALAYPSLAEGFGLPVLEALACGAPVVTSSTTSLPEVVGEAAILVDPEDINEIRGALLRVLEEPRFVRDLRAKALVQASRFSWRRAAEETLSVYQRAASD